jgi:hypothetical protein
MTLVYSLLVNSLLVLSFLRKAKAVKSPSNLLTEFLNILSAVKFILQLILRDAKLERFLFVATQARVFTVSKAIALRIVENF